MNKVYRYRLYPSKAQNTRMCETLELCQYVYNRLLATRRDVWELEQTSLNSYDINKIITQWKAERLELKTVHSQVLQDASKRVDLAFKSFFRRVKNGGETTGYPRFKGWFVMTRLLIHNLGLS